MTSVPPEEGPNVKNRLASKSLVIVNTGDGKGKSSSAFGVVVRAVAREWPVGVVQFLKSGKWQVGEEKICRDVLGVDWWAIGDGFTWDSKDISEDQAVAVSAWEQVKKVIREDKYRLVVLDEITYPINWGWIELDEVVSVIKARPVATNVVITGRDAPEALIDLADTVTEMRKIKHAFDNGIMAKKGIDY